MELPTDPFYSLITNKVYNCIAIGQLNEFCASKFYRCFEDNNDGKFLKNLAMEISKNYNQLIIDLSKVGISITSKKKNWIEIQNLNVNISKNKNKNKIQGHAQAQAQVQTKTKSKAQSEIGIEIDSEIEIENKKQDQSNLNLNLNYNQSAIEKNLNLNLSLNQKIQELISKLNILQNENQTLKEKIQKLEENKNRIDTIKLPKNISPSTEIINLNFSSGKDSLQSLNAMSNHASNDKNIIKKLESNQNFEALDNIDHSNQLKTIDKEAKISKSHEESNSASPSTNYRQDSNRVLSLNQLKELINDIFEQKSRFDIKCYEARLPRQTIEQYTYTYFNQKYGLRSLIVDWTSALINGIKLYSLVDSDILLFGEILKNECDEDFRIILNQTKSKINEMIIEILKKQFKHKSENELVILCSNIKNGYIEKKYWKNIITQLFRSEHSNSLEQVILKQIELSIEEQANIEEKKLSKFNKFRSRSRQTSKFTKNEIQTKILFTEFQNIILNYQIINHENYLKGFIKTFKEIDHDEDGILNEDEFRDLLAKSIQCTNEQEINQMLRIVDPFCHNKIPLSECLALFSSEIITCTDSN